MLDLNTLYQQLDKRHYSAREEFVSVQEVLRRCQQEDIALLPGLLSLYYFPEPSIYEIYWLDLLIEPVGSLNFEDYMLDKMSATRFNTIKPEYLDMRRHCFINMTGNPPQDTAMLIDYLSYILSHDEMKEEIRRVFGDYDERYLALAFYL